MAKNVKGGSEEYDPHAHRNVPVPTTNFETFIHLLKSTLGTGILAMPDAFKNAGVVIGTICTILIGILCTYCLHTLIECKYQICKRKRVPQLSYRDSMKIALLEGPKCLRPFANCSVYFIDIFLITYQLGICCVYIVFVASSLRQICISAVDWRLEIWMLIILVPLILMNSIKNLKLLAPFSTAANVFIMIGLGIVVYYITTNVPKNNNLSMWGSIQTFPLFFGTTLFALNAVGVVIAIEENMKEPKKFRNLFGVFNIAMGLITLAYAFIGYLGYRRYGSSIKGSVTLNFPDEGLAKVIQGVYAVAVFISYALQCYPPINIIWNTYLLKRLEGKNLCVWEYGLRLLLVIIPFILAIAIPMLNLFISLCGALCISLLGLAFPAIMEICINHPNFGTCKINLLKNIFIIIIAVLGLVDGTATTVIEMVKTLKTKYGW